MITQEYLKELFDYHNGKLLWKIKKASRTHIGDVAGWKKRTGYWEMCIDDRSYQYHRMVFLWHHGYLPVYVDHIDRNPSNNRIENLRSVSGTENRINSSKTWTKHGFRGVKETRNGDFEARITKKGVYYHLGTYETPEEASEAYQNARQELFPGVFS